MAAGVALVLSGPKSLGIICIGAYGGGIGLGGPGGKSDGGGSESGTAQRDAELA